MSPQLISRSPDLQRLRDEGYEVEIRSNYLLVHSIPYVNASRETARAILVSDLTLAGDVTTRPGNHIAWFTGDHPCRKDGTEILGIKHSSQTSQLAHDIVARHSFSNKPPRGYNDYYEKMIRYIEIISAPAQSLDPSATARTFKPIEAPTDEGVFNYIDTASSRAGISAISLKLAVGKIAIIGLGGTGSYVLDLVAKTPVREIHLFDGDAFLQHNAFRAPAAASLDELQGHPSKVAYFKALYSKMRRNIVAHDIYISGENAQELKDFDFVFLCLDKGPGKKLIVDTLHCSATPFIDVGIGVQTTDDSQQLWAICRVTTSALSLK